MYYKALILDLDGTTVPNRLDGVPSPAVVKAIAKARNKIHICIATGRNLELILPIIKHLKLSGPCIIRNGSQLYDPIQKKMLREIFIDQKTATRVFEIISKYDHIWYAVPNETKQITKVVGPIINFFAGDFIPAEIEKLEKDLQNITHIRIHKMVSWVPEKIAVTISATDASKQHGVLQVAKILGITPKEMIGVGDSYNDFSLLMACGLKFAMRNAVSEVKNIADFIAPSINDDGVATIIHKFILAR